MSPRDAPLAGTVPDAVHPDIPRTHLAPDLENHRTGPLLDVPLRVAEEDGLAILDFIQHRHVLPHGGGFFAGPLPLRGEALVDEIDPRS